MTTKTAITKPADAPLGTLAGQINTEHAACEKALRASLEHAFRAGELLADAKRQLPHGDFSIWIEANCEFSARTAQGYMRLARYRPELEANTQPVAGLGVRDALAMMAESRFSGPGADVGDEPDRASFGELVAAIGAVCEADASDRQKRIWVELCFECMRRFNSGVAGMPPGIVVHQVMLWTCCPGAIVGPNYLALPETMTLDQHENVGRYLGSIGATA